MLFLDNCSVHHSKKVTKYLDDHNIKAIFNIAYCPQFNPIERVWSVAKNYYKRRKLEQVAAGKKINHEQIVRQSIQNINKGVIQQICGSAMDQLLKNE